jgi:hypothetical protein
MPRGDQAEGKPSRNRHCQGKGQHRAVETRLREPRDLCWCERDQPRSTDPRERDASTRAERRENERLGQQLANDASTSGSDRQPQCDFAAPRRRTAEQQARGIGARDCQHARGRGRKNHQRGTNDAEELLAHRLHDRTGATIFARVLDR